MAVGIVVRSLCGHLRISGRTGPWWPSIRLLPALFPSWEAITEPMSWPCFLAEPPGTLSGHNHRHRRLRPALPGERGKEAQLGGRQQGVLQIHQPGLSEADVPVLRLKGPKIVMVDEDVAVLKEKGPGVGHWRQKGSGLCRGAAGH